MLTSLNAVENTVWISRSTALITRIRVAPSVAHILQLLLEEHVARLELVELLEGQWIDRTHEAELAFEVAHAGRRRDSLGKRRLLGSLGRGGLEVVIASQRLDDAFQPHPHFGLVDLHPA